MRWIILFSQCKLNCCSMSCWTTCSNVTFVLALQVQSVCRLPKMFPCSLHKIKCFTLPRKLKKGEGETHIIKSEEEKKINFCLNKTDEDTVCPCVCDSV